MRIRVVDLETTGFEPDPDALFPECAFLDAGRAVREAMLINLQRCQP